MALPIQTAAPIRLVRYGFRVAGTLKRADLTALEATTREVSVDVLSSDRAHEDKTLEGVVLRAIRDAVDDELDELTRWARLQLIGRNTQASREAPYTTIFHSGIGHYIAAPLNAQEARYKELAALAAEHLPEDDPVRVRLIEDLDSLIPEWVSARSALADHDAAISVTRSALATSKDNWRRTMDKIYGAVVIELGKATAERFFKSPTTNTNTISELEDTPNAPQNPTPQP